LHITPAAWKKIRVLTHILRSFVWSIFVRRIHVSGHGLSNVDHQRLQTGWLQVANTLKVLCIHPHHAKSVPLADAHFVAE